MPSDTNRLARIGGPSLLARHQFLALGLPVIIAVSLAFGSELTIQEFAIRILIGLALLATLWLLAEAAKATVFRNHRNEPVHPVLVLAFGSAMGGISLLLAHYLGEWAGVSVIPLNAWTVMTALVLGGALIGAASLIELLRADYRLEQRLEFEAEGRTSGSDELQEGIATIFDDISAEVSRQLAKSSETRGALDAIDKVIDEAIKPLTRGGFRRRTFFDRYFILRGVTRDAVVLRPFAAPVLVAALYSTSILVTNQFLGSDRASAAVPAAAIDFVVVTGALTLARFLFTRYVRFSSTVAIFGYFSSFAVLSVVTTGVNQLLFWEQLSPSIFVAGLFLNFATILVLSLVVSIMSLAWKRPTAQADDYPASGHARPIGGSTRRAVDALVQRRLVHHLHSTVQNRVLALRMGYPAETAFDASDIEARVLDIIDTAKREFLEQQALPLADSIDTLKQQWAPVLAINVTNTTSNLTFVQQNLLFLVLQECVSNSVRHGLATEVDVTIEPWPPGDSHSFRLRVSDNGVGPVGRRIRPGVGLRFIDEVSEGSYSFGFGPEGGSCLDAVIRC